MDYNTALEAVISLDYRDKLRLAQLLIQLARKEEEAQYVKKQPAHKPSVPKSSTVSNVDSPDLRYIKERLLKSKPGKVQSLQNFIDAMFQFKGSVSESKRNQLIKDLQKAKVLRIENNKVTYL